MADLPAFLFYPEDFATGTADMSPTEVGIYIRCLCHQWHKLFVPDDATKVARIVGATPDEIQAAWPAVRAKFIATAPGELRNARLEKVRRDLRESQKRRSKSGKAGAAARWSDANANGNANGKRKATAKRKQRQTRCGSDGKMMPSRVENENSIEDSLGFEDFWKVVHRKEGKGAAQKAYERACARIAGRSGPGGDNPDAFLIERMVQFAKSPRGKAGRFSPHPSTWLNEDRFDDDPAVWNLTERDHDPRGTLTEAARFLEMENA
jgi:uncharacterized protein YdaU (DUF1376 family)